MGSFTASLELCKELYELSGWEDVSYCWLRHIERQEPLYLEGTKISGAELPAYDLGYLLRKLPKVAITRIDQNDYKNPGWVADTFLLRDRDRHPVQFRANTPEDAAAKLSIELFKNGILTREQL